MADRSMRRKATPADLYRRLWGAGPEPELRAFLDGLPALAPDELVDVMEIDRAERWRRGNRIKAERYLKDFPDLAADTEAALVIIYGEYYLRKERGETPSLMEYIARFPNHARRLRDQVMWHEAIELGHAPSDTAPPEVPGLAVGEIIGRGGMCVVFRGVDEVTGQVVAVKVLDAGHLHHPLRVARFRREVGSLMRLSHPHIVKAHRTGEFHGLPYLIMEYCPGGTLAGHLKGKPLPAPAAAGTLRALAGAVSYAHGEGVVHRDLKPGNVLLAAGTRKAPDGAEAASSAIPKIADFGLAKCQVDMGGSLTASRETLGTPCYMAPELAIGARDADARTDVYGLGAILYELLTGRPPFVATIPMEVVRMVREELPVPPSALNRDVPPMLEGVCLKCLEKEPEKRFQTAADVAEAVRF
jgi:eukaryotic-like serine/threonine-protein kinase